MSDHKTGLYENRKVQHNEYPPGGTGWTTMEPPITSPIHDDARLRTTRPTVQVLAHFVR